MEWVTTTGSTVEEAKERALDQLGVALDDAEFEVLEEPKKGLFGRQRGEARVRARVRPTQARQKVDRRDRRREKGGEKGGEKGERAKGGQGRQGAATSNDRQPAAQKKAGGAPNEKAPRLRAAAGAADTTKDEAPGQRRRAQGARGRQGQGSAADAAADAVASTPPAADAAGSTGSATRKEHHVDAHQVGAEAQKFMVGLLDAFGLEGNVTLVEDGDDLEVRVDGKELGLLVGPRGATLQAVQDLARVASQRRLGDHDTRLRVDIGGYRERRRAALGSFAQKMAEEVKESGVARVLEPMSSADRKIIHDTLSGIEGIATRSEGDDPYRRVIITPAND